MLADPQLPHARLRVELDPEAVQQPSCGLQARLAIHEKTGDHPFAAEKDVVGDAEFGDEVEFLMDDGDPGCLGVAHIGEAGGFSIDADGALVVRVDAGQDLHQRRLAGAVLAHERMDFARAQFEAHILERRDAAERFRDRFGRQNWPVGFSGDRITGDSIAHDIGSLPTADI